MGISLACLIFTLAAIANPISTSMTIRMHTWEVDGVTLPLGIMTFVLIHFNTFKHNKLKDIWL